MSDRAFGKLLWVLSFVFLLGGFLEADLFLLFCGVVLFIVGGMALLSAKRPS